VTRRFIGFLLTFRCNEMSRQGHVRSSLPIKSSTASNDTHIARFASYSQSCGRSHLCV
jgi:hypothetical protein